LQGVILLLQLFNVITRTIKVWEIELFW